MSNFAVKPHKNTTELVEPRKRMFDYDPDTVISRSNDLQSLRYFVVNTLFCEDIVTMLCVIDFISIKAFPAKRNGALPKRMLQSSAIVPVSAVKSEN
jgi:hypothetical protein